MRAGRHIVVAAVSARDRRRDRGIDLSAVRWYEDAVGDGGRPGDRRRRRADRRQPSGVALAVIETALARGKHVVTANKALMAEHGTRLAAAGRGSRGGARLRGGGRRRHPDHQDLAREPRRQPPVARLRHPQRHLELHPDDDARERARVRRGAWPKRRNSAMPKPIRASTSTASTPRTSWRSWRASRSAARSISAGVYTEGIRHISRLDIDFAEELGYRIKLLGIARLTENGLEQRVHPCMVRARHADRRGRGGVQRGRRRGRFRRTGGAGRARRRRLPDRFRGRRRSHRHRRRAPGARRSGCRPPRWQHCPARRWSATRAPITSG